MGQNDGPEEIEPLRQDWRTLYSTTLPSLARAKDPAQPKWPVTLDHCFARIILDNTIGKGAGNKGEDVQWDQVLQKPAIKHMSEAQLRIAIKLGQQIQHGEVDVVELDRRSLEARRKNEGKYNKDKQEAQGGKRKRLQQEEASSSPKKQKQNNGKKQSTIGFARKNTGNENSLPSPISSEEETPGEKGRTDSSTAEERSKLEKELDTTSKMSREHTISTLRRIQTHSGLTPFRRRLYTSLLSVPRAQYTTYAALAAHLSSVARAVGNGMRNNPFAPDVPCHRVLASDRQIGGFGGDWSRDGKLTKKQEMKQKLLQEEGVKFDSTGRVKGPVWKDFWDLEAFEKEYGKVT